ncbi:DnaB-like helicase N-terminal domain-containing protein [Streptomyces erythrochromogenes]|uniref:DnaB-like helicase N-terminal domain-containing protein n=1 Tax=Streptomyces erythrochromogenes TaxID=285574 RepID=UPI00225BA5B6|nr:DnaB-like helicase N-terminal domain-containing protein [Streptomyces erythrochromogenes]MCX5582961.1 replicative DNA helicase [Streptomyces erythrochromogenes]
MPNPASNQEDLALDDVPPDPPVRFAEQALLGAVILEPLRIKTLGPLGPEHFSVAMHGALFAAMSALTPPAPELHAREPVWITVLLDHARPHARGLTASYLHTLTSACPNPSHAPAYAQMIVANRARLTIRAAAERLVQAATDLVPNPAAHVLDRADAVAAVLDNLAGLFPSHPGSLPRTVLPPPPTLDAGTGPDAVGEEQLLLSTAAARAVYLPEMRWLRPEDFTVPLHGLLYRCMTSLAYRGDPVDAVTVLWEAQHHGFLASGTTATEVLDILATPAGSPEHWGEQILQRSLLHHAHTTGLHIHAFTDDPANTPHQLITGSRRALADLGAVRARWQHATRPPSVSPSATKPVPAARAGPATPRITPPAVPTRASR